MNRAQRRQSAKEVRRVRKVERWRLKHRIAAFRRQVVAKENSGNDG